MPWLARSGPSGPPAGLWRSPSTRGDSHVEGRRVATSMVQFVRSSAARFSQALAAPPKAAQAAPGARPNTVVGAVAQRTVKVPAAAAAAASVTRAVIRVTQAAVCAAGARVARSAAAMSTAAAAALAAAASKRRPMRARAAIVATLLASRGAVVQAHPAIRAPPIADVMADADAAGAAFATHNATGAAFIFSVSLPPDWEPRARGLAASGPPVRGRIGGGWHVFLNEGYALEAGSEEWEPIETEVPPSPASSAPRARGLTTFGPPVCGRVGGAWRMFLNEGFAREAGAEVLAPGAPCAPAAPAALGGA